MKIKSFFSLAVLTLSTPVVANNVYRTYSSHSKDMTWTVYNPATANGERYCSLSGEYKKSFILGVHYFPTSDEYILSFAPDRPERVIDGHNYSLWMTFVTPYGEKSYSASFTGRTFDGHPEQSYVISKRLKGAQTLLADMYGHDSVLFSLREPSARLGNYRDVGVVAHYTLESQRTDGEVGALERHTDYATSALQQVCRR